MMGSPSPGADWRLVPGHPGFFIDRDKAVWSTTTIGGRHRRPGPWRKLAVTMRGRNGTTPCVRFPDGDGRQRFASVARLYRAAFLDHPPLPEGPPSGSGSRVPDDDPDWCRPAPAPIPPARCRPLPPVPLPAGSPRMSRLREDDDWSETPYAPPAPAPRMPAIVPAAMPEGGMRPSVRGSAHGRAVLDEAKVARMKRLRSEGWSTGRLAREFGVGRNNVCYVLNGRTWGHVEAEPATKGGTR